LSSFEITRRPVHGTHLRHASLAGLVLALLAAAFILSPSPTVAQQTGRIPTAALTSAPTVRLPGAVDSNSPAVWDLVNGNWLLSVMTSFNGQPSLASGPGLTSMGQPGPVTFVTHPGDGVWMEAVVADAGGTWYGYYHNEVPATPCGRPDRMIPRIGAARSADHGRTWEDLGIILEAPPGSLACGTPNQYFVGGVGDVGAVLDRDSVNLYLYFSQYQRAPSAQGVAVARLLWASRDEPVGDADVWVDGIWQPAAHHVTETDDAPPLESWTYPTGTPLEPVTRPWHDVDRVNNAFWGASVHWNEHLQQYVMLVNRTKDEAFTQEGIYVSFAPSLEDPVLWSEPQKIVNGGRWYPQVVGLTPGEGTDRITGSRARFFMSGTSTAYIDFRYR
jgi:hypothetical protein